MVRQYSQELQRQENPVRINSVEPGVVVTDFAKVLWDENSPDSKMLKVFDMQRAAQSSEIANLMCFLASEQASFITGENYKICGGSPGW